MYGTFDATQHQPRQAVDKHPVGKFPFVIKNTECMPTKDQQGGMFVVTFESPAGQIVNRYNLWNSSAKAVEIAHGQLSALCYATGVFRLNMDNQGVELRNARGMMEVGFQKGEEPTQEKPDGGYVEIKRVYDSNGNEPGKAPAPQAQPQQQNNPPSNWPQQGQQGNGSGPPWGNNGTSPAPLPQTGGWQAGPSQSSPPWANTK